MITCLAVISVFFKPSRKGAGDKQKNRRGGERGIAEKERKPHPKPLRNSYTSPAWPKENKNDCYAGYKNVHTISINLDLRFFRFASFFVGEVKSDWAHLAVPSY